jgi:hypothetical protein
MTQQVDGMVSEEKRISPGDVLCAYVPSLLLIEGGVSPPSPSRYLDPDPLLLATTHGGNRKPQEIQNPRFHALNQAIVQLVGRAFDWS